MMVSWSSRPPWCRCCLPGNRVMVVTPFLAVSWSSRPFFRPCHGRHALFRPCHGRHALFRPCHGRHALLGVAAACQGPSGGRFRIPRSRCAWRLPLEGYCCVDGCCSGCFFPLVLCGGSAGTSPCILLGTGIPLDRNSGPFDGPCLQGYGPRGSAGDWGPAFP